jgi:hypothetical protein
MEDDGPLSWNVLGDHISNPLVVLNPLEVPVVPEFELEFVTGGSRVPYFL